MSYSGPNPVTVEDGGTQRSSATAYTPICGGITSTSALQSVVSTGTAGEVLTSNGPGALPTFQAASAGTYFSLTPYIVGADVHSQFTTIGAAITQAVTDGASAANPKNIYVKPGTYTGNISIPDGINIRGMISNSRTAGSSGGGSSNPPQITTAPVVLIVGTITYAAAAGGDSCGSIMDLFIKPTTTNANAIAFNTTSGGNDYFTITNCVAIGNGTGLGYVGLSNSNAETYVTNSYFSSYTNSENGNSTVTNCWINGNLSVTSAQNSSFIYCSLGNVSTANSNGPVLFNNCIISGTTNVSAGTAAIFQDTQLASAVTGGSASLTFSGMSSTGTLGGAASTNSVNETIGNTFVGIRSSGSASISVLTSYFGMTGTAGATLSLPTTSIVNQMFVIKDEGGNAGTNNITLNVTGGTKTIDGATSQTISVNFGVLRVIYDGTNYFTW